MTITVNPILIAAAVLPAVFLLIKVEREDHLEKESRGLLFSLVAFGIISTAIASLGEGYRFELRSVKYPEKVKAGAPVTVESKWVNVGVSWLDRKSVV